MNPIQIDPVTHVLFGDEAVNKIYKGVRIVTEATATTLGPLGRNVLIDKGYQTTILHDGVSVAESILLYDEFEKNGARVAQEAARKQRDAVGDGTTAVMVLLQAILDEGLKARAGGINPMLLRKGLESGSKKVVERLLGMKKEIKDLKQKIQIATISAEDPELGKMIAETIHKIGEEGVLTVEESKASETFIEYQEGMQIDKGYAHFLFLTDPDRQIAVLEDVSVLVTDKPIMDIAEIGSLLEHQVFPNTRKLLIIAPDFSSDFLNVMIRNKLESKFMGLCVRAPGVAGHQFDILQDICALTGARFVTKEAAMKFSDLTFADLGHLNRVVASKISTLLQGGKGTKDAVLARIQNIRGQMEDETLSIYDKEQLKARMGKLTSGIAVIKVGGSTEIEMKERKERAIDAIASTQSAVRHGFVIGGEVSYLNCIEVLDDKILGEKILKDALRAPFTRLVTNAGYDAGEKFAELRSGKIKFAWDKDKEQTRVLKGTFVNPGFDVVTGEFKDMIASGIIDSVMIPIEAIKNSVSVSTQLLSLGAAVVLKHMDQK